MKKIVYLICIFFIIMNMILFAKTNRTSQIVINRNENNGYMNVIESVIIIEKKENNTYTANSNYVISDFKILDEKVKYNRNDISLCGGEKITLLISSGDYRLKCITPIKEQNSYLNTQKQWESEYKYISLKEKSKLLINIYPETNEGKYLGGWILE